MTGPSCSSGRATELLGCKIFNKKALRGEKKNIYRLKNFQIFDNNYIPIIWPITPRFCPGQSSLAPPILVRWWQTMTRWNCDTKGRSFLPSMNNLAVFRGITKNNNLAQGKQTVCSISTILKENNTCDCVHSLMICLPMPPNVVYTLCVFC